MLSYLLYKHSCKQHRVKCKDLLQFRMELVHLLLEDVGRHRGVSCSAGGAMICLQNASKLGKKATQAF